MNSPRTVDPYSDGYFLVNAETVSHARDNLVVAEDYFAELSKYVSYPLLKVSNDHYWARPERRVPGRTVVLPEETDTMDDDTPILLAKDETAGRLVDAGIKETPRV